MTCKNVKPFYHNLPLQAILIQLAPYNAYSNVCQIPSNWSGFVVRTKSSKTGVRRHSGTWHNLFLSWPMSTVRISVSDLLNECKLSRNRHKKMAPTSQSQTTQRPGASQPLQQKPTRRDNAVWGPNVFIATALATLYGNASNSRNYQSMNDGTTSRRKTCAAVAWKTTTSRANVTKHVRPVVRIITRCSMKKTRTQLTKVISELCDGYHTRDKLNVVTSIRPFLASCVLALDVWYLYITLSVCAYLFTFTVRLSCGKTMSNYLLSRFVAWIV